MSEMNDTPRGNRVHIAFFGLRNAGKSTLVNEFTGQPLAIVSDVAGTTTDPVSKAMEILPLGPCMITDTAGLDDTGELGEKRVAKSLAVLANADVAVWVSDGSSSAAEAAAHGRFLEECRRRNVTVLEYMRGDSVEELKRRVSVSRTAERTPRLLEGLVERGDRVLCIVPIDESAPKGRLILPQQQVIRECLDAGAVCTVCQPAEALDDAAVKPDEVDLAITDSQAFGRVKGRFARLTSFSILFARQKGDLAEYQKGLAAIARLKDGDTVLVAEGCTHRRQCNDIGTVKIPRAVERISGAKPVFKFASGSGFPLGAGESGVKLIVQCGGCMLTRREVLGRIALAKANGVPIVNYGMVLAAANGLQPEDVLP